MTYKNASGSKAVAVSEQEGRFFARYVINVEGYHNDCPHGLVVESKWFSSIKAAEKYATKTLN